MCAVAPVLLFVGGVVGQGNPAAGPSTPKPSEKQGAQPGPQVADGVGQALSDRQAEVVVEGRSDSLVGVADSAGEGVVGREQLSKRPILRRGEILEAVPGVIITQHTGAGKGNQLFLRGFNLDHGTDFATWVNGMPVNMPSHGHGQGYTDLNFIIPELIDTVRFRKGPYRAQDGDFASAGTVRMDYVSRLDRGLARIEYGMYRHSRALVADSFDFGSGHLLYGLEVNGSEGRWVNEENFNRVNGVLRYSEGDESEGWSATAMAYSGKWNATDHIPLRALGRGLSRWDTLDPTSGGDSQRYSLSSEWHRQGADSATRVSAYGFYYDLDLFSNFTYLLRDQTNGDQFEQVDRRVTLGVEAEQTWFGEAFDDVTMENSIGFQTRNDFIENGLHYTRQRRRLSTVRTDDIIQNSFAVYAENRMQWNDWLRSTVGVRGDFFFFDVESDNASNSANENDAVASPKVALVFGPWAETEIYLNGGYGFHSNDARGVTIRDDPTTAAPNDGNRVEGLVQSKGGEIGVRTTAVEGLQSTVSLWYLELDSELVFVGDGGTTEPNRGSRRYGVEIANYWKPWSWLTVDADLAFSRARFRSDSGEGDRVPNAVETVVAAGLTGEWDRLTASFRMRHLGESPLAEDNSVRSQSSTVFNAGIGYRFNDRATLRLDALNLFDKKAADIQYFYPSRIAGEPAGPDDGGFNDIHFHPVEPFQLRIALTLRF